jgi:hypothetical protein
MSSLGDLLGADFVELPEVRAAGAVATLASVTTGFAFPTL